MSPLDLIRCRPEAFEPGEQQRLALAFQQAWQSIEPNVSGDPREATSVKTRLAKTIIELAGKHLTVASLANAAIFKAVRETGR